MSQQPSPSQGARRASRLPPTADTTNSPLAFKTAPNTSTLDRGIPSVASVGNGRFAWCILYGEDVCCFASGCTLFIFAATMLVQRVELPSTILTFTWNKSGRKIGVGLEDARHGHLYIVQLVNESSTPWDDEFRPWKFELKKPQLQQPLGLNCVKWITWRRDDSIVVGDGESTAVDLRPVTGCTDGMTLDVKVRAVNVEHRMMSLGPDGYFLAALDGQGNSVRVWNTTLRGIDDDTGAPESPARWPAPVVLSHTNTVKTFCWRDLVQNGLRVILTMCPGVEVRMWVQCSGKMDSRFYTAHVISLDKLVCAQWVNLRGRALRTPMRPSSAPTALRSNVLEDCGVVTGSVHTDIAETSWIMDIAHDGTLRLSSIVGLGVVPRVTAGSSTRLAVPRVLHHIMCTYGTPTCNVIAYYEREPNDPIRPVLNPHAAEVPDKLTLYLSFEESHNVMMLTLNTVGEPMLTPVMVFTGHANRVTSASMHPSLPLFATVAQHEIITWHVQPSHVMSSAHFGEPTNSAFFRIATYFGPKTVKVESSPPMDVRSRLTRYLEAKAPEKLASLDKLLMPFKGREEEVIKMLSQRYGPEDAATPTLTTVEITITCCAWSGHSLYVGTSSGVLFVLSIRTNPSTLRLTTTEDSPLSNGVVPSASIYSMKNSKDCYLCPSGILTAISVSRGVVVLAASGRVYLLSGTVVQWQADLKLEKASMPLRLGISSRQGEWEVDGEKHLASIMCVDSTNKLHAAMVLLNLASADAKDHGLTLHECGNPVEVPGRMDAVDTSNGQWAIAWNNKEVYVFGIDMMGHWEPEGTVRVADGAEIATACLNGEEGSEDGRCSHAWLTLVSTTGRFVLMTSVRSDRTPMNVEPFEFDFGQFTRWKAVHTVDLGRSIPRGLSIYIPRSARIATYAGPRTCVLVPTLDTTFMAVPVQNHWKRVPSTALPDCHPSTIFSLLLDGRHKAIDVTLRHVQQEIEEYSTLTDTDLAPLQRLSSTHDPTGAHVFTATLSVPVSLLPLSLQDLIHEREAVEKPSTMDLDAFLHLINHNPLPGLTGSDQLTLAASIDILKQLQSGSVALDAPASHYFYHWKQRNHRQLSRAASRDLKYSHMAWGMHSETQEQLFSLLPKKDLNWAEARSIGLPLWIKPAYLKLVAEAIGKAQFAAVMPKEPRVCALWYVASGKRTAFGALCRACNQDKLADFFTRNFDDEKNRFTAARSAYNAMSSGNIEFAAAFFLLAQAYDDVVQCIVQRSNDWMLAFCVIRLALGDKHEFTLKMAQDRIDSLNPKVREQAWERHILMWFLDKIEDAVRVLTDESCHLDPSAYTILTHIMKNNPRLVARAHDLFPTKRQATLVLQSARYFIRNGNYALGLQFLVEHLKKANEKEDEGTAKKRAQTAQAIATGTMDFSSMFGGFGMGPAQPTPSAAPSAAVETTATPAPLSSSSSGTAALSSADKYTLYGILYQALCDFFISRMHILAVLCKRQSSYTQSQWARIHCMLLDSLAFVLEKFPFSEATMYSCLKGLCRDTQCSIALALLVPQRWQEALFMSQSRLAILSRDCLPSLAIEKYTSAYDTWYQCQELMHLWDACHALSSEEASHASIIESYGVLRAGLTAIATRGRILSLVKALLDTDPVIPSHSLHMLWDLYTSVVRAKFECDQATEDEWAFAKEDNDAVAPPRTLSHSHTLSVMCHLATCETAMQTRELCEELTRPTIIPTLIRLYMTRCRSQAIARTSAVDYRCKNVNIQLCNGGMFAHDTPNVLISLCQTLLCHEDVNRVGKYASDISGITNQLLQEAKCGVLTSGLRSSPSIMSSHVHDLTETVITDATLTDTIRAASPQPSDSIFSGPESPNNNDRTQSDVFSGNSTVEDPATNLKVEVEVEDPATVGVEPPDPVYVALPWEDEWNTTHRGYYRGHVCITSIFDYITDAVAAGLKDTLTMPLVGAASRFKKESLVSSVVRTQRMLESVWMYNHAAPSQLARESVCAEAATGSMMRTMTELFKQHRVIAYDMCVDYTTNDIIAVATHKGIRDVRISGSRVNRHRSACGRFVHDEEEGTWEGTWKRYNNNKNNNTSSNTCTPSPIQSNNNMLTVTSWDQFLTSRSPSPINMAATPIRAHSPSLALLNSTSRQFRTSPYTFYPPLHPVGKELCATFAKSGQPAPDAMHHDIRSRALTSHPFLPIYLSGGVDHGIYMYKFGTAHALKTYRQKSHEFAKNMVTKVHVSTDGSNFVSADHTGRMNVWRVEAQGYAGHDIPLHTVKLFNDNTAFISDMAFLGPSPTLVAGVGARELRVYDGVSDSIVMAATLADPKSSKPLGDSYACAYHKETSSMFVGTRKGEIVVFDLRNSQVSNVIRLKSSAAVRTLSIDPTGTLLASGTLDGDISLWNPFAMGFSQRPLYVMPDIHPRTKYFALEATIPVSTYGVMRVRWSPNSRELYSCGSDGRVVAFSLPSGDAFRGGLNVVYAGGVLTTPSTGSRTILADAF